MTSFLNLDLFYGYNAETPREAHIKQKLGNEFVENAHSLGVLDVPFSS